MPSANRKSNHGGVRQHPELPLRARERALDFETPSLQASDGLAIAASPVDSTSLVNFAARPFESTPEVRLPELGVESKDAFESQDGGCDLRHSWSRLIASPSIRHRGDVDFPQTLPIGPNELIACMAPSAHSSICSDRGSVREKELSDLLGGLGVQNTPNP